MAPAAGNSRVPVPPLSLVLGGVAGCHRDDTLRCRVRNVTFYLDLPGPRGKLDRLLSEFGAAVLSGPPPGLDEVPADKALVCVGDMGDYEAAGYILTEAEFATWTDPADTGPKTWLIIDRDTAGMLCPGAAEGRESWQSGMESDAEAAAHTDNLVPVARASRSGLRRDVMLLREYAAALRGALTGTRADELLTDVASRRIASADLEAIAKDLESWAERDWIAVIDLGPAPGSAGQRRTGAGGGVMEAQRLGLRRCSVQIHRYPPANPQTAALPPATETDATVAVRGRQGPSQLTSWPGADHDRGWRDLTPSLAILPQPESHRGEGGRTLGSLHAPSCIAWLPLGAVPRRGDFAGVPARRRTDPSRTGPVAQALGRWRHAALRRPYGASPTSASLGHHRHPGQITRDKELLLLDEHIQPVVNPELPEIAGVLPADTTYQIIRTILPRLGRRRETAGPAAGIAFTVLLLRAGAGR